MKNFYRLAIEPSIKKIFMKRAQVRNQIFKVHKTYCAFRTAVQKFYWNQIFVFSVKQFTFLRTV